MIYLDLDELVRHQVESGQPMAALKEAVQQVSFHQRNRALRLAVEEGWVDAVKFLMNWVHPKNEVCGEMLVSATHARQEACAQELLSHSPMEYVEQALTASVSRCSVPFIAQLMERASERSALWSPALLDQAVERGRADVVDLVILLQAGQPLTAPLLVSTVNLSGPARTQVLSALVEHMDWKAALACKEFVRKTDQRTHQNAMEALVQVVPEEDWGWLHFLSQGFMVEVPALQRWAERQALDEAVGEVRPASSSRPRV